MSVPEILPAVKEIAQQLGEPKDVYTYFLNYTQVPHGSNNAGETDNHKEALEIFKKWAGMLKLEYQIDEGDNMVIRKPASKGCEGKPSICIQAHMDMVCQKEPNHVIDFKKDGLKPVIRTDEKGRKWLMAEGTSLGADDGIGVAAGFAILADDKMKHGPLELLITRDEEVGLIGAANLGPSMIKSNLFINVDSEEEDSICYGCAGGFQYNAVRALKYDPSFEGEPMKVSFKDFHGGHTGVECNVGYANPLKVMARLLKAIELAGIKYRLCNFTGGSAHNAIPRDSSFEVVVCKCKVEEFKKKLSELFEKIKKEYSEKEKKMNMVIEQKPVSPTLSECDTKHIIDFFHLCHDGPFRMSPDVDKLVESSLMTTIARKENGCLLIIGSGRSSSGSQLDCLYEYIRNLCEVNCFSTPEKINPYPGWLPNPKSPLIKAMEKIHADQKIHEGNKVHSYAIHAGLECGLIIDKYPQMDCASIGPLLESPHSPSERLLIESVPRFYNFLKKTVEHFAL